MDKHEQLIQDINFQAGNLEKQQFQAMVKAVVGDSKIMCIQRQLGHGSGGKNAKQKVPEDLYDELYQTLQAPEQIFENTQQEFPKHCREFLL
jgi:hypothetical protein